MGKRFRRCSLNSKSKRETYAEDRISQLPDEILISIISRLTIKEAAKTGVLSHRWENLWKSSTCLNFFYDANTMCHLRSTEKLLKRGRIQFIRWVNQVLDLHSGSNIDEFKVSFDLDKSSSQHLDKWITFATMKRVKKLEIFLMEQNPSDKYTFPEDCYSFIKSPSGLSNIKLLRSLLLRSVNVNGELLEHFLSNCPLLERLFVQGAGHLVNLRVASLRLKYFQLLRCSSFKKLEICAPNLKFFGYAGHEINLQVGNLPHMVDLLLGGGFRHNAHHAFHQLSSYFSQLETLKLDIHFQKECLNFPHFPELTNLKHLIFRVAAYDEHSLLGLSLLIKSCPLLSKFTLELKWIGSMIKKKIKKGVKCPLPCLKIVEMVGFVGGRIDVELAMFFIENATTLEKIIINPRSPYLLDIQLEYEKTEKWKGARTAAEKLGTKLSSGTELVIL